jgi:hypothetical protein
MNLKNRAIRRLPRRRFDQEQAVAFGILDGGISTPGLAFRLLDESNPFGFQICMEGSHVCDVERDGLRLSEDGFVVLPVFID